MFIPELALEMSETEAPLVVADTRRLAQEVAWQPKYDLSTGLDHVIEWWKGRLKLECSAVPGVAPASTPG
jgi:nucleoside-diphosphate-sugar epimerase